MSSIHDRLTGSGWQQQVVATKVSNAKKKIEQDNLAFGVILDAAMTSKTFDEDVINFLTDQFLLPLPLTGSKEEFEGLGYYVLRWTTLEYSKADLG